MNDKGKNKAPQVTPKDKDVPEKKLIIGPEKQSGDEKAMEELSSGACHSGNKRKQSSLLQEMNDCDPPVFDFRSIPIRKPLIRNINQIDHSNPSGQCYPYLVQEKYIKNWKEIILLAESHTNAAIREIVYRPDLLCNLEKKLEEAKDPIAKLINFEKENYEIIENMSNDLESVGRKIVKLKEYSRQVLQCHTNSLLYYAKKVEQKDNFKQPKPTQEKKESPGKKKKTSKEKNSEKSDAVSRP